MNVNKIINKAIKGLDLLQIKGSNASNIVINGKSYNVTGNNITISNGKVIVDGIEIADESNSKKIEVIINGDVGSVECAGNVHVNGNSLDIKAGYNVEVGGDCLDIDCGGNVKIQGKVRDVNCGGNVTCGDVSGSISCGGNVNCGKVEGDIDAGCSVRHL